jgi:hypothetical protein
MADHVGAVLFFSLAILWSGSFIEPLLAKRPVAVGKQPVESEVT